MYMHVAVDTAKLLGLVLLLLLLSVVCLIFDRRDAASALSVLTGVILMLLYLQTDFPMPMSGMKTDLLSGGGMTRMGPTNCEETKMKNTDDAYYQAGEDPETVSFSDTEEEAWSPYNAGQIGSANSAYKKIIKSASDHRTRLHRTVPTKGYYKTTTGSNSSAAHLR